MTGLSHSKKKVGHSADVVQKVALGYLYRFAYLFPRCQVNYRAKFLAREKFGEFLAGIRSSNIELHNLGGDALLDAGGEVVDDNTFMACGLCSVSNVCTDVAGTARYEDFLS